MSLDKYVGKPKQKLHHIHVWWSCGNGCSEVYRSWDEVPKRCPCTSKDSESECYDGKDNEIECENCLGKECEKE